MKATRFLLIGIGVFAVLGTGYYEVFRLTWAQNVYAHDPLEEILTVKAEIARDASAPRWFILGGSSVWFGFDSDLIAAATGQSVVNLGAHAEVPLWFQLGQVEREAKAGDTVLIAAELVHYWRERPTTFSATRLGPVAPEAFARAGWERQWELLSAIPPSHVMARLIARIARGAEFGRPEAKQLMTEVRARWAGSFTGEIPGYYNYLEIGPRGDFTRPRSRAAHEHADYGLQESHKPVAGVWRDLAATARRLRAAGVACYYTWPPFEKHPGLDVDSPTARANLEDLRVQLGRAGWTRIGAVDDAILEPEYFYDTPYHLTIDGAKRRTRRFIEQARAEGLMPGSKAE